MDQVNSLPLSSLDSPFEWLRLSYQRPIAFASSQPLSLRVLLPSWFWLRQEP
jgi:hypothetical protein